MPNGIFVMPTIGEQLGGDLQTIAKGIQKFTHPNHDIQVALREQIATNPALLQQLVDLGPDAVGKIFGKEAGFLGVGEKSLGKQVEESAKGLFGTSPQFKEEMIASKTGTKTSAERQIQQLDITGKELGNRTNASQLKVQEATEKAQIDQLNNAATLSNQKITEMQQAIAKYPNLGDIDIGNVARRIASGRNVDPMVLQRLQQAGVNYGEIVNSLQQQAQIAAQFSIARLREQSKEVKLMALSALEKRADDTRNMIAQADKVINDMQKPYQMASMVIKGKAAKDSPFYQQALSTINQYEQAVLAKKNAQAEYDLYNPKRNQMLDILIGREAGTGGAGTIKTTTTEKASIDEVVPADILPYVNAAQGVKDPTKLKAFMDDFKAKNPVMFDRVSPYINATSAPVDTGKKTLQLPTPTKVETKAPKISADTVSQVVSKINYQGNFRKNDIVPMDLVLSVMSETGSTLNEAFKATKEFMESREGGSGTASKPTKKTPINFQSK